MYVEETHPLTASSWLQGQRGSCNKNDVQRWRVVGLEDIACLTISLKETRYLLGTKMYIGHNALITAIMANTGITAPRFHNVAKGLIMSKAYQNSQKLISTLFARSFHCIWPTAYYSVSQLYFYRPQWNCEGYVFTGVCLSTGGMPGSGGGGCLLRGCWVGAWSDSNWI